MPFEETHVVDERRRFIEDVHRSLRSVSELCRRYGISRKTGYKWLKRWETEGPAGLEDRSSRPRSSPRATPPEVVAAILAVRRRYPDYGAKKIGWYLERRRPDLELPSRTTIHNVVADAGLVAKRRSRLRRWHPGYAGTEAEEPNGIWSTDFKGQFPTGDGRMCYPLTVQDVYSRLLVGCRSCRDVRITSVWPLFTRFFKEFGLPSRIRSDNGSPFASNSLGRLSRLSVWFVQLGIVPEFIEPGCPYQNGTHENMHLVLKRRTTRPPSATHRAQDRAFDRFRREYNEVRPHEALGGKVPADLYVPSSRPFPKKLEPVGYPGHFETRLVSSNAGIRWYTQRVTVSSILAGHNVGLEEVDHGLFDVYFGPVWLGRFIEAKGIIVDAKGPAGRRHQGGTMKGRRTVTQVS